LRRWALLLKGMGSVCGWSAMVNGGHVLEHHTWDADLPGGAHRHERLAGADKAAQLGLGVKLGVAARAPPSRADG
jgi:hypothetical protein